MLTLPHVGNYSIIYADPPWDYAGRVQHGGTSAGYTSGAATFYPTMTPRELMNLPVRELSARKAILFLWTTGPQFEIAVNVAKVWGFTFKTVAFVWDKVLLNPGAYTMSQCEYVLACVRGCIPKPRGSRNERQYLCERRSGHSRKPAEIRTRIDRMFPRSSLKRVELFAVERVEGWDYWGYGVGTQEM